MIGTPLVLASNITGFTGVVNTTRGPDDPLALQCPGKGAMFIEAISFAFDHFADHEVSIQIGRAKITNGYQPITSILTPQEARLWGNNSTSPRNNAATWRFDQPLYCTKATRLAFMWKAKTATLSKVSIALKCRLLPEAHSAPRMVSVPWATTFRPAGTVVDVADTTSFYRSIIGDLTNHFRTPLHVRHIIGSGVGGTGDEVTDFQNDAETAQDALGPSMAVTQRQAAQVRIHDWLGNNIVRDATTLNHLCQMRNEWRVNFQLPASKTLFVTMDERHAAFQGRKALTLRPSIGIVGWRSEFLEEVQS